MLRKFPNTPLDRTEATEAESPSPLISFPNFTSCWPFWAAPMMAPMVPIPRSRLKAFGTGRVFWMSSSLLLSLSSLVLRLFMS